MKAFGDVSGTFNELKRMSFEDETGDYGYSGKFRGKACFGRETPEEVLECASQKYKFSGPTSSDEENRKSFAVMDIKEACAKSKMCYGKDENDIPIEPHPVCIEHEACPIPGASLAGIPPDIMEFYKGLKDAFFSLKKVEENVKARSSKKDKQQIKKQLIQEMSELVKKYNELPYPEVGDDSSFSDSKPGSNSNSGDGSTPSSDESTPSSDGSTPSSDESTSEGGSAPSSDGSTPSSDGNAVAGSDSMSCDKKIFEEFKKHIKKEKVEDEDFLGNNNNNTNTNNNTNSQQEGGVNNGTDATTNEPAATTNGQDTTTNGQDTTTNGQDGATNGQDGATNEPAATSNEVFVPPKSNQSYNDELKTQDDIPEGMEGIQLTHQQKLDKMEGWYKVWTSPKKTQKRKETGCQSFPFFEDMSDTDYEKGEPNEESIKKYYIASFLRAVEGHQIFNEEKNQELEQEVKKNQETVEKAQKEQKGGKGAGKYLYKKGSQGIKYASKATGITEMLISTDENMPGVDINCDTLNLTMASINYCFAYNKKNCNDKYAHKMGIKKKQVLNRMAGMVTPLGDLGNSLSLLSSVSGLQGMTWAKIKSQPFLLSNTSQQEIEKKIMALMEQLPQGNCICRNYVPTGIFQLDWKYYRLCFLNFKQVIRVAEEKGISPDYLKKKLSAYFINDFFSNFGNEFSEFRKILLEFDLKYRKLCKLKLRLGFSVDRILQARAKELKEQLKSYDKPIKQLAGLLKEKEAADRIAYKKYGKLTKKQIKK